MSKTKRRLSMGARCNTYFRKIVREIEIGKRKDRIRQPLPVYLELIDKIAVICSCNAITQCTPDMLKTFAYDIERSAPIEDNSLMLQKAEDAMRINVRNKAQRVSWVENKNWETMAQQWIDNKSKIDFATLNVDLTHDRFTIVAKLYSPRSSYQCRMFNCPE